MNLIPQVKELKINEGFLKSNTVSSQITGLSPRLFAAFTKLPLSEKGVDIVFNTGNSGEGYEIIGAEELITVNAEGEAGAFYAVQTLRQIFTDEKIPCFYIKDYPDFKNRGFYHDVTRGKVPTVETVKKLIDKMAYLKLNSLQLYVEHTFEFKECKKLNEKKGCLTAEELRELDAYCKENFIDFIPSIATFGHLFELLQQDEFKHLRVLDSYNADENFWNDRMAHHTINPQKKESIEVIKSLVDQYYPLFTTEYFNICCDETFDLSSLQGDTGKIYVDFVKEIIAHLKAKGKKIMMWGDILLQHPEFIEDIPEDTIFLNWGYSADPGEENIKKFASLNRTQYVCPGTSSWSRLCENTGVGIQNISNMARYGKMYGAEGVLNTNWGDWGNPCSIELANYGLTVGAEKSWSEATPVDDSFDASINKLIYGCTKGAQCVKALSRLHLNFEWNDFIRYFYKLKAGEQCESFLTQVQVEKIQSEYDRVVAMINSAEWETPEFKEELLSIADMICLVAELSSRMAGYKTEYKIDFNKAVGTYEELWLKKNKKSELHEIVKVFKDMKTLCENN